MVERKTFPASPVLQAFRGQHCCREHLRITAPGTHCKEHPTSPRWKKPLSKNGMAGRHKVCAQKVAS
eukprot:3310286-Amphidinium_carterae.2